jgi:hypothetical protein
MMMKQLLLIGAIMMAVPFMTGAQTPASTTTPTVPAVTLPDPGLVPGDFFYFLDRWGEGVNSFFTFNPESKAHLALKHAQERASEVHAVLKEKGADAPEVAQAKQDFESEMNLAAAMVANQKAKGADVSAFAKDINDEFDLSKDMLKEAYRGYHDSLHEAEKGLREQLKEATKAGDMAAVQAIQAQIQGMLDEQATVKDEERAVDVGFDTEKQHLEDAMGDQQSAESHITNAERGYRALVEHAQAGGLTLDQNAVASYQQLIASAKEAFAAGDFETAKEDAKEAKRALVDMHQSLDTNDDEGDFFGGMNGDNGSSQDMTGAPEVDTQGESKKQEIGRPGQGGLRVQGSEEQGMMQKVQEMPNPDMRSNRQE